MLHTNLSGRIGRLSTSPQHQQHKTKMPHSNYSTRVLLIFAAVLFTMTLLQTSRVDGFLARTGEFTRSTGADSSRQQCSRRATMLTPSNAKSRSGAWFEVAQDENTDTDTLSRGIWADLLSGAQHAFAALERDASTYSMMKVR